MERTRIIGSLPALMAPDNPGGKDTRTKKEIEDDRKKQNAAVQQELNDATALIAAGRSRPSAGARQ